MSETKEKITINGRIGKEIKMVSTQGSGEVANFQLATGKDENVKWIAAVAFKEVAEKVRNLEPGNSIEAKGYLIPNLDKDKNPILDKDNNATQKLVVESFGLYKKIEIEGRVGNIEEKQVGTDNKDLTNILVYENKPGQTKGTDYNVELWQEKAKGVKDLGLQKGDEIKIAGVVKITEEIKDGKTYTNRVISNPTVSKLGVAQEQGQEAPKQEAPSQAPVAAAPRTRTTKADKGKGQGV